MCLSAHGPTVHAQRPGMMERMDWSMEKRLVELIKAVKSSIWNR